MVNLQYSHPRKYGKGSRACRICGNRNGLIRKYSLNVCRRCFRENAAAIGFRKYRKRSLNRKRCSRRRGGRETTPRRAPSTTEERAFTLP
eukprot:CAMPEP_0181326326 /NCGR_PEP_ID=MMETSP1101-20121128/21433_1 /TAXON_ID=46948 /ORGANISM="Rhodomonas abbreviata, Strain Caron Lab Isolate" /LENGTH=89 /DNA_ID=CAMNT_0023434761 /DNA_START=9 /DNA_END=275 /DNA_ORIENTATION=+